MTIDIIYLSAPLEEAPCILCGQSTYSFCELQPEEPKRFGLTGMPSEPQVIHIPLCERHPFTLKIRREILKRLTPGLN